MSSCPKADLHLDWCSHAAAKYAVEHWHYSRSMPSGKSIKVGVWENGVFIGVVIFSQGATHKLVQPYGLSPIEGCELTRIALSSHATSVSRIIAVALKYLVQRSSGIRLVVSFADTAQSHHGGIYQASNWIYTGLSHSADEYVVLGKRLHGRTFRALYGRGAQRQDGVTTVAGSRKHRYLFPLDAEMRARIAPLAKPYPKRERSRENAAALPSAEGGVIPTRSLHSDA